MEGNKTKLEPFDHLFAGIVTAFFIVGILATGFLYYKFSRSVQPGDFSRNQGEIIEITSGTITLNPKTSSSKKQIRITEKTIILDFGKEVVDASKLQIKDNILVHGIQNDDYIEAVSITLLPQQYDTKPTPIRKTTVID